MTLAETDMNPTQTALRLALPNKGRLLDPTLSFLADCGFRVKTGQGSRDYTATIPALPHCVVDLMNASEIPDRLISGEVHLGVTGLDLIAEALGQGPATLGTAEPVAPGTPMLVHGFGFGRADLVVAVPRAWIDVDTMADLAEVTRMYRRTHKRRMRIATKYRTSTQAFFTQNNVLDYRIVRSAGATEAAPATGTADIVVDITSTGKTLADNHLKILRDGVMLSSSASLFVSRSPNAKWSAEGLSSLQHLFDMIDAKIRAASRKLILTKIPDSSAAQSDAPLAQRLEQLKSELSEHVRSDLEFLQTPSGSGDAAAGGASVMLTVAVDKVHDAVVVLRRHAAREIVVHDADYVFDGESSSFDKVKPLLPLETS